jgi:uncharacterized membrane protein YhaH (DUF805 family)
MVHDQIAAVFKKGPSLEGRSRRAEFWRFTVVAWALCGIASLLAGHAWYVDLVLLLIVCYLGALWLATMVRRLHDTGRTAVWVLLALVPVGDLVLLYVLTRDSDPDPNRWGTSPKPV